MRCAHDKRYEHGVINEEDVCETWCLKCNWDRLTRKGRALVRRIDSEIAAERITTALPLEGG